MDIEVFPREVEIAEEKGFVEYCLTVTNPDIVDPLPLVIFVDVATSSGSAGMQTGFLIVNDYNIMYSYG